MKTLLTVFSLAMACVLVVSPAGPAWAQFEGSMELNRYQISPETGQEVHSNRYEVKLNADRMLFRSTSPGESVDIGGVAHGDRVLVRLDREDFILLDGREQGVAIRKQEVESLMDMLENMGGAGEDPAAQMQDGAVDLDMKRTGQRRSINGFQAQEWVLDDPDSENRYHVWLTGELDIHWGMLAEPWFGRLQLMDGVPFGRWIREGRTPVLVEHYLGDRKAYVVRLENIREGDVTPSDLEVPEGVQLLSFQQLLMQQFQNR